MGDDTPTSHDPSAQDAKSDGPPLGAGGPDAGDQIECSSIPNGDSGSAATTRLYKKRWAIVFLFSSYSLSNAYQWIQYGIISNIMMKFYNVDAMAVDWLSMVYMLTYIPFIFPVTWLLDKGCGSQRCWPARSTAPGRGSRWPVPNPTCSW